MEAYREARGVGSLWGTLAALPGAPRSLGKAAEGRAKPSAFGFRGASALETAAIPCAGRGGALLDCMERLVVISLGSSGIRGFRMV